LFGMPGLLESMLMAVSAVPVYQGAASGFNFDDVDCLPRLKAAPAAGTRVCVAYTTSLYRENRKTEADSQRVSFNVQWVIAFE